MRVTASAPGKVILAGEHSAVYGRPALVAAIDRRLEVRCRVEGAAGTIEIDLPDLKVKRVTTWEELLERHDRRRQRFTAWAADATRPFAEVAARQPEDVVEVALAETRLALTPDHAPALRVQVRSEIPLGSGYGSSAALAVALVGAAAASSEAALGAAQHDRIALAVERFQHGRPSGIDSAIVRRGGTLWAERAGEGWAFSATSMEMSHMMRLRVWNSGRPGQSTGEVVAAVAARHARDRDEVEGRLDRLAAATRDLRAALRRTADAPVVEAMRRLEHDLEGLGVVPDALCNVARRLEDAGMAAKISGAGALAGAAAGSVLVYDAPEPRAAALLPPSWAALRAELGAEGYRLEVMR